MRGAVATLALVGGIVGLIGVLAGLGLLGVAERLDRTVAVAYPGLRLLIAFAGSVLAIVAGAHIAQGARHMPGGRLRLWGAVLVSTAIIASLAVGRFFVLGGVLVLLAGSLAIVSRESPAGPEPGA